MNRRMLVLTPLLVAALMVGCNNDDAAPSKAARVVDEPTEPLKLSGQRWNLISINGAKPVAEAFLLFDQTGSQYRGNSGCNQISGTVSGTLGSLQFGAVRATKRMCTEPAGAMEQEQALFLCLNALSTSAMEGDTLVLEADGQRLEFKPAAG